MQPITSCYELHHETQEGMRNQLDTLLQPFARRI